MVAIVFKSCKMSNEMALNHWFIPLNSANLYCIDQATRRKEIPPGTNFAMHTGPHIEFRTFCLHSHKKIMKPFAFAKPQNFYLGVTRGLFVYKTSSISTMHHKSKQRRQKAQDNGVAPSVQPSFLSDACSRVDYLNIPLLTCNNP